MSSEKLSHLRIVRRWLSVTVLGPYQQAIIWLQARILALSEINYRTLGGNAIIPF